MRIAAVLSLVTALLIFSQLATGGPFLFGLGTLTDSIGNIHWILGGIAGLLSIIAVIAAWLSKPAYNAYRYTSIVIVVLFFLVGSVSPFSASEKASVILPHYELAVILFGTAIAWTFYTVRWNRMPKPGVVAPVSSVK